MLACCTSSKRTSGLTSCLVGHAQHLQNIYHLDLILGVKTSLLNLLRLRLTTLNVFRYSRKFPPECFKLYNKICFKDFLDKLHDSYGCPISEKKL